MDDIEISDGHVEITAHTRGSTAVCPCCGTLSRSVKDYRPRKLHDIEFLSRGTTIYLWTKRFRCLNSECSKTSFMEPLRIAEPYSRMTRELGTRVEYESLNQSARLARESLARQHIKVSNSTCIRRASRLGKKNPEVRCSGYVAIDDWAFRKGHRYMCAIVDHYYGTVLAVFDGRYIQEIADWFKSHPEVKLISRDGSREYAALIRVGRPDAVQVTDRFHLVKNLKDTMVDVIKEMLGQTRKKLKHQYPTEEEALQYIKDEILEMGEKKHRNMVKNYFRIRKLIDSGTCLTEVSRIVGMKIQLVYRLKDRNLRDILTKDQLAALQNAPEMARIISNGTVSKDFVAKKMAGKLSSRMVARCMATISDKYQELRRQVREHNKRLETGGKCMKVSKKVIWHYIKTGETSNEKLIKLNDTHPMVNKIIHTCMRFMSMIHADKGSPNVDEWIQEARISQCSELCSFASYIEQDKDAVRQAYETYFSNGIMEGTVNKIKAIKRSMFNRAEARLLRAKLIYANY